MCAFSSFLRDLKKKTNRMEDGLVCLKIDKNEFTQRKYNTVQYDNPKDRERGCRQAKKTHHEPRNERKSDIFLWSTLIFSL
jgi:hypothetical protein